MRAWQSEKRMAHWTAALSLTGRWSSKVAHACLEPNCRRPKYGKGNRSHRSSRFTIPVSSGVSTVRTRLSNGIVNIHALLPSSLSNQLGRNRVLLRVQDHAVLYIRNTAEPV